VRAQIGDYYRRSTESYLGAAAADPSRGAGIGSEVMARVSSSAYLAQHMSQGALIPTAYYTGDTFRPAAHRPLTDVLHPDHW
jgi:hypothetical protein